MSVCAACKTQFSCAVADEGKAQCWCMQVPALSPQAAARQAGSSPGCLCPACLQAARLMETAPARARPNREEA